MTNPTRQEEIKRLGRRQTRRFLFEWLVTTVIIFFFGWAVGMFLTGEAFIPFTGWMSRTWLLVSVGLGLVGVVAAEEISSDD